MLASKPSAAHPRTSPQVSSRPARLLWKVPATLPRPSHQTTTIVTFPPPLVAMSVARALQNVDILCAICEELAPEHYTRRYRNRRRRELANLAGVCSAFSDPATRVLWRVLLGVGPVLGLLPSVAVTKDARGYSQPKHYVSQRRVA